MTMEKDSREPNPADRSARFQPDVSGPPMWVAVIFFAVRVRAYRPEPDGQVAAPVGARTGGRAPR